MNSERDADRLAAASLAEGDPTGWFDRLYHEAEQGTAEIPWDRPTPTPQLAAWAAETRPAGAGRRALVVGCGLGRDAEFVAAQGYATTAFDISATAVRVARDRHPGSLVRYVVADLLDPPESWLRRFDLVVESNTVQALPRALRDRATAATAALVAPGGTLLVLAAKTDAPDAAGPPWPLTRAEIESFARDGLDVVSIEDFPSRDDPAKPRWRAVFTAR